MIRSIQPRDGAVNTLAAEFAETIADAMDQAGLTLSLTNTMAVASALGKALERVGCERERAVRQNRIERRETWVHEHGLLTSAQTAQRLELTPQEMETAQSLGIIAPVEVPLGLRATSDHFTRESWWYYLPSTTLTDAERAQIAHHTLITRAQAAARLGVPLPTFDHLRLEHGLTPVNEAQKQKQGGSQSNLYRVADVDRLATPAREPAPPIRRNAR